MLKVGATIGRPVQEVVFENAKAKGVKVGRPQLTADSIPAVSIAIIPISNQGN